MIFKPVEESDLELMRRWRMQPDIQRWMVTDIDVTHREQRAWWARESMDCTSRYWLAIDGDEAIGLLYLTSIHAGVECEIGLYAGPMSARGQGRGVEMIRWGTAKAMQDFGCKWVRAWVMIDNEASLRAFARAGYASSGRAWAKASKRGKDVWLCELVARERDWR